MKAVFGVLSLLVVVAIIGLLARKQLGAGGPSAATSPVAPTDAMAPPSGGPRQQVQQFKQAAEAAVQQARPMPDDTK